MDPTAACEPLSAPGSNLPNARLAGLVVAGVTFAVFSQCIFFDFAGWDDVLVIAGNPRFNPPTLESIWFYWTHRGFNLYQPLTYSLWAGLAKLSALPTPDPAGLSMNPFIFHLTGLFLHTVAVVAVYGILLIAVRSVIPAAFGAIAFGIHPLMTESVAFIGAMNTPFAAALALSALWLHLSRPIGRARGRMAIATLVYSLSLLAKPTTVTIPLVAVLLEISVLHRSPRRAIVSILPWILVTIPCIVWTRIIQTGSELPIPALQHLRFGGYAVAFYLAKIFWPVPLSVDYGRTPLWMLMHSITAVACLVPVGLLVLAWIFRRRSPVLAVAVVLYMVMLLPNSGLVSFDFQRISSVADRYAYLAMVAFALAISGLLSRLPVGGVRRLAYGALTVALIFWLAVTTQQLRHWRNGVALFSHAVAVNPRSSFCWQCLSEVELSANDPFDALAAAVTSIKLNPSNEQFRSASNGATLTVPPSGYASAWAEAAQAHVAKANALDQLNRLKDATDELNIAVQMNPGNVIAITDLAFVLGRAGEEAKAQTLLRRALAIDPSFMPARAALRPRGHLMPKTSETRGPG